MSRGTSCQWTSCQATNWHSVFLSDNYCQLSNEDPQHSSSQRGLFVFFQKNVVEQFCPVFCHRDDEPVSRPIGLTGPVRPALDGSTGQPASVWLSCVCDPTIPDPAFDRKLAIYWMDRVERISCKDGKKMSELHFLVHIA